MYVAAPGLPGRVHVGVRAAAIALDRVKGVSNLIRAGDRVDVAAAAAGDGAPAEAPEAQHPVVVEEADRVRRRKLERAAGRGGGHLPFAQKAVGSPSKATRTLLVEQERQAGEGNLARHRQGEPRAAKLRDAAG